MCGEKGEEGRENLVNQIYLGSEHWIRQQRERVESKPRSDEHPRPHREVGRPTMAQVVTAVGSAFKTNADEVRHGHGGAPRMLAAWLGCYEGLLTLRKIAAGLRLSSTGRASELIRMCDRELDRDGLLRVAVDRCCDLLRGSPPTRLAIA